MSVSDDWKFSGRTWREFVFTALVETVRISDDNDTDDAEKKAN
jgi:hypothetical protein